MGWPVVSAGVLSSPSLSDGRRTFPWNSCGSHHERLSPSMNSLNEYLEFVKPYAERLGLHDAVVFIVGALCAVVGYVAAVIIHSRQITAQREGNRRILQMERNELNGFMRYIQVVASNVDEKGRSAFVQSDQRESPAE